MAVQQMADRFLHFLIILEVFHNLTILEVLSERDVDVSREFLAKGEPVRFEEA